MVFLKMASRVSALVLKAFLLIKRPAFFLHPRWQLVAPFTKGLG